MLIVKPYGRSVTIADKPDVVQRKLARNDASSDLLDIPDFARTHDELVIAQWVSIIDKFATKPAVGNGPTDEQRSLRERLGKAAWAHLVGKGLLPGISDAECAARLGKLWQMKIAPYGKAEYRPRRRNGREMAPPTAKGRSYEIFSGGREPTQIDPVDVVAKIHGHLYEGSMKKSGVATRRGLIETRAESIAKNVLRPAPERSEWSEIDEAVYLAAGDVAAMIRTAAERRDRGEDGASTSKVTNNVAGPILYRQWEKVFIGDDGSVLGVKPARDRFPGVFALHMAVKDFYVRRLKHHRKAPSRTTKDRSGKTVHQEGRVISTLPTDWASLLRHIGHGRRNRDLNALVRLGKVIHYEMSDGAADATSNIIGIWPSDFAGSRFWTSAGQAEIKRNEAFVRVWRHVLALASRTLTDWCNPTIKSDILLKKEIAKATGDQFDRDRYVAKCPLLFGGRSSSFRGAESFEQAVLKMALCGTATLRHKAFHFAGRGGFLKALEGLGDASSMGWSDEVLNALQDLWSTDRLGQADRLRATMVAAHLGDHYDCDQVRGLYQAITRAEIGRLPLPRLARVLARAANTTPEGQKPLLPPSVNRLDLENPSRFCAYTSLKLVYEKPFRTWLEARTTSELAGFIDKALARSTSEAQRMNGRDVPWRSIITSRAANLGALTPGEAIHGYLDRLTAATATEMRVQAGYESDGDKAREQAAYIEEFKCDIVALALRTYLDEAGFSFLLEPAPQPNTTSFDPTTLPDPSISDHADRWQQVLYFLVHLVPVEEVGRLLHQLRKWAVLVSKGAGSETSADPVLAVLELYLDMHDAKFEGGAALIGTEAFRPLFETQASFDALFPTQVEGEDRRVPRRGLREIMRFGHLPALLPTFQREKILSSDVSAWLAAEASQGSGLSQVASYQQQREALHAKWAKDTRSGLGPTDKRAYAEAVCDISRHRQLSAKVTLTDHVRLHRLLMSVFGRLVDFSGLWERDIYFSTLALVHERGVPPTDCFSSDGLSCLANGQIISALDNAEAWLCDQLAPHFGHVEKRENTGRKIRNDFAHFNMLRSGSVNLSHAVNDARQLLRHDRKLTNAVSGAVIDLLAREGLELSWEMNAREEQHRLEAAKVKPRQATHLARTKLVDSRDSGRSWSIEENMHGPAFVEMVAALFAGQSIGRTDITSIDFNRIDWQKTRADRKMQHRPPLKRQGRPDR